MYKKIALLIIILLLLMSLVTARTEPQDIEITRKEVKEISDTQNEVTYYLKINFYNPRTYGYNPTYGRIMFFVENDTKFLWFQCDEINWYKSSQYDSSGYLNSKISINYNKTDGIPIIKSAEVRMMRAAFKELREENDVFLSSDRVSVIDNSNGYELIENNIDSNDTITNKTMTKENDYQNTLNPSVKSDNQEKVNSSSSHYSIFNFIIDIIGGIIYLILVIGFLNSNKKKWTTIEYIMIPLSIVIYIIAGNYKLLLIPIVFLMNY